MDKSELKKVVHRFLIALEKDGFPIDFAGIPPVLPEYEMPYNLQIYAPKLLEMGVSDALNMLAHRQYELWNTDVRGLISHTKLCRKPEDIACRKEDIIINKIKYQPLTIPYRMLEMV
jgi:hypothetical protein